MTKPLRRIFQFPVALIMATYYLLTAIVRPIIRPIVRLLAELRIFKTLRQAIEKLGPYPSLILLALPVVIVEPPKVVALAIMQSGHILVGIAVLLVSEALSLLVVERLFEVVKPKLLELHWFAVVWGWFTLLRDQLLTWFHATWAWPIVLRVRDWARSVARRCLDAIGVRRKV